MTGAGYWGLFVSAFVAATLLPAASEAALGLLATARGYDIVWLIVVATAGNTLGAAVNWALGRFCLRWQDRRWFPIRADALARATDWFRRRGVWVLLLAWLPVIGDPLTFAAGVLRTRFDLFILLVAAGKAARYILVAMVARGVFG